MSSDSFVVMFDLFPFDDSNFRTLSFKRGKNFQISVKDYSKEYRNGEQMDLQ